MGLDEAIGTIPKILEHIERLEEIAMRTYMDEYITPERVEEEFGISRQSQAKLRSDRMIPYYKPKGKILYLRSDIVEYIEECRIEKIDLKSRSDRTGHRTSRKT